MQIKVIGGLPNRLTSEELTVLLALDKMEPYKPKRLSALKNTTKKFCHFIDLMPLLHLELCVTLVKQQPLVEMGKAGRKQNKDLLPKCTFMQLSRNECVFYRRKTQISINSAEITQTKVGASEC